MRRACARARARSASSPAGLATAARVRARAHARANARVPMYRCTDVPHSVCVRVRVPVSLRPPYTIS
eukprot:3982177-Pleurochrysis_carterae.AAC.1